MALRSPYEYVTKWYPSLARAEFLLVVIWLLIDTLSNVLPNPQCPGPFLANTCNFSLMISFLIYLDDPNEILSTLSLVRHVVLLLFAHTSKFHHILKMAILLVFYFSHSLSLVYLCWLCTVTRRDLALIWKNKKKEKKKRKLTLRVLN